MKLIFAISFLVLFSLGNGLAKAQTNWEKKLKDNTFCKPLKIPMYLSGNFCELRSNHFHGGLDIKTKGVEGFDLHAIEAGYISRIKISAYGYGYALYIDHPNSGLTSVYAHMQTFSPSIKKYIQSIQKQNKKNSIDHSLKPNEFPIKKDEIIGKSGNSGGSYAPHLHFELRDARNQHPINPMFAFDIKDNVKPEIAGLMVYDFSQKHDKQIINRRLVNVKKIGEGKYEIPETLNTSPFIGFGAKVFDKATGAHNKNGVYEMTFFIDNVEVWGIAMNEYSYSQTRYINSLIDYEYFKKKKSRFVKLFKDPNNKLSGFSDFTHSYSFQPHKTYKAQLVCKDIKGNISVLNWSFNTNKPFLQEIEKGNYQLDYNEALSFSHEGVELSFSSKSLYTDLDLSFDVTKDSIPKFVLKPEYTPIHQRVNVKLKCPEAFRNRIEKTCIVQTIGKHKSWIKPKVNRLDFEFRIRSFGSFSFDIDDDDPYATFPHLKENANASSHNRITVKAYDLHSGISKYNAKLDGEWVILEYDPKKKSFFHYFENKPDGKKHTFEFEISDICSNKNTIKRTFVR